MWTLSAGLHARELQVEMIFQASLQPAKILYLIDRQGKAGGLALHVAGPSLADRRLVNRLDDNHSCLRCSGPWLPKNTASPQPRT